ncbi:hypothetical protein CBR_g49483 [Chara braunii]|uniref:Arginyl-tRNA--protein transferase n=1 Tax=Chara braunii TaxID=69332 RepID=A0A388K4Y9_CHABU|nr:hypothetical protein CBR_g49483 [Chara braunii]|eukprot:GBG65120.1 hypothetical protein CBR_g49483 [Chara braunii]
MATYPSSVADYDEWPSRCGYCSRPGRTNLSCSLRALTLRTDDYEEFLNRGWRRSGNLLYKPVMHLTCCPLYTIRVHAWDFCPSKEQMRVRSKMERYLRGDYVPRPSHQGEQEGQAVGVESSDNNAANGMLMDRKPKQASNVLQGKGSRQSSKGNVKEVRVVNETQEALQNALERAVARCVESRDLPDGLQIQNLKILVREPIARLKSQMKKDKVTVEYTCNVAFQIVAIAKNLGLADLEKMTSEKVAELVVKRLKEEVVMGGGGERNPPIDVSATEANKGHINFYKRIEAEKEKDKPLCQDGTLSRGGVIDSTVSQIELGREESLVSEKRACQDNCQREDRMDVAMAEASGRQGGSVQGCTGRGRVKTLQVTMARSTFIQEEFELYQRYQTQVHDDPLDEVTVDSYCRFLVDSPLLPVEQSTSADVPSCGLGAFHQQYRIDGRLVAVGVVDILPRCLSSKYLFWDPDFAFLSLGKYSVLQEIDFVKRMSQSCPAFQYYYLGSKTIGLVEPCMVGSLSGADALSGALTQ